MKTAGQSHGKRVCTTGQFALCSRTIELDTFTKLSQNAVSERKSKRNRDIWNN